MLRRILVAAFAVAVASTGAMAQVKVTDAADIGNELAAQIEAIVHVLNNRKCLTSAEERALLDRVHQIRDQSYADYGELQTAVILSQSAAERVRLRLRNYRARLERLWNEIQDVPRCPETQTTGVYVGGQIIKNGARVRSTETSAATGAVTNQFSDSGDPIGAGFVVGYDFAPWRNWVVGPFVSFDWLDQTINHNFAGGQFLGTTTHWMITAGAKLGYDVAPNWLVYGLAGVTWLNQDLNVNFATAASKNTTAPGFTLGLGAEVQPSSWRLGSYPVSLFLQYQHTWYSTANFDTPSSSPLFNYAFKRDDDTVKLGVNIYLQPAPAPAARPALITK